MYTLQSPGTLLYNWSNICMHYFSVEWLHKVADALKAGTAYHVARKKIPSKVRGGREYHITTQTWEHDDLVNRK